MTTYDKPYEVAANTGSIRPSKTKSNPKSPDYFGSFKLNLRGLNIVDDTVEFKLSGWKQVDKSGNTYLSLKLNDYKPNNQVTNEVRVKDDMPDDDIPF
jgi:uncharacterized protein (DUF736 family)